MVMTQGNYWLYMFSRLKLGIYHIECAMLLFIRVFFITF